MRFLPFVWLVVINLIGLAVMGWDKQQARHGGRRIRERTIFAIAVMGGSIGVLVATQLFAHKRRKSSFMVVAWAILALHLAAAAIVARM